MKQGFRRRHLAVVLASLFIVGAAAVGEESSLPSMLPIPNPIGAAATFSTAGKADLTGLCAAVDCGAKVGISRF